VEKAFHLGDKLTDSIMPNESHQCIVRLKKIIRPLSKTCINKLEELIIKVLLMCMQFQEVNEVTLKSLPNVISAFKKMPNTQNGFALQASFLLKI
jgi:hypothetical protein